MSSKKQLPAQFDLLNHWFNKIRSKVFLTAKPIKESIKSEHGEDARQSADETFLS